jgi:HNH endonuclease
MALYRPPSRLKAPHKRLLKTAWSIRQGYDGSKLECFMCSKLGAFAEITVHHGDNIESHNDPDNLSPACWECNRKEGLLVRRRQKAEVASREREILAHMPERPQPGESDSLQRHKKERLAWNLWLYHPKTGFPQGSLVSRRGLPLQAPDQIGYGSSKTYWFYLEEDTASGYWEVRDTTEGEKVERTAKQFPLERMGMKS